MPKPYSYDLRKKVIQAIELDGMKKTEAAQVFGISRNTINLWLKRQAETGDFQALPNLPTGNGHKITDREKFRQFVKVYGEKTQAEMASLWGDISARTISRSLKKIGFTRKKKTYGYRERDETKRKEFVERLAIYKPADVVYIDEAGMDNREDYSYGWNEKGERFHTLKSGRRQGRVNMIAAWCEGKVFASFTVEGACNRTVFEIWLETCLIPALKPGQVVIADNATFHKGGRIQELIEAAGCHLQYLPAYSPDLNKIERCWSWLKSRIRKQISKFDSLRDAMEDVLFKVS
jgi:transposase